MGKYKYALVFVAYYIDPANMFFFSGRSTLFFTDDNKVSKGTKSYHSTVIYGQIRLDYVRI